MRLMNRAFEGAPLIKSKDLSLRSVCYATSNLASYSLSVIKITIVCVF